MGLGLSVDKLLEMFRADRRRSRETIADYLDAVAAQATALASIWRGILSNAHLVQVEEGDGLMGAFRRVRERDMRRTYPEIFEPNAPAFAMLSMFYREVTLAIGGRIDKPSQEELMADLANMILDRTRALESRNEFIQAAIDRGTSAEEVDRALNHLTTAVESLGEEAAALATLALRWRANM